MDAEALQALLQADPKSYDIGMLKPMRKELEAAQAKAQAAGDGQASEDIGMLQQAVEAVELEQISRLDKHAGFEMDEFEKAVKAKRDVELRWIDDDLAYEGDEKLRDSKAYPNDAGDRLDGSNERPAYRALKSRTIRYASRMVNMMIPNNDIPMKVDPSPSPDPRCFPDLQATDPNSIDLKAYAAACAGRMQETNKAQLTKQGFTSKGRKVVFDGAKWGTGIMKGPFNAFNKQRKPMGPDSEIVLDESPMPGCDYIDPWFFYDDMSPTLDECSKCYEVHLMDRRKLHDMKRYPNIIESNIDVLLEDKDPKLPTELSVNITTRNQKLDRIEAIKDRWAVIEMHGIMKPEEVEDLLGQKWTDKKSLPLVEFWFCNGKALKCKLSAMECDWRVPYYNFTPFPCDDTIWGYGVPRMGRGGAKIIRGALDATMRNASIASGPCVAYKPGFEPADQQWIWKGPKFFKVSGDGPIQENVYTFNVEANVEGNLALLQKGLDILDDDILLDQVVQGDIPNEEIPASGLLQIINLRTIFQRMIAAQADDTWFKPMGERWTQWNIQFNTWDKGIKGDFDVSGIASTTLVSKDLQIQHLQVGMQVAEQPMFAGYSDAYAIFSAYWRMLDIPDSDKMVYPKDQAMQNQQQMQQNGGDPMVAVKMQELQLKEKQASAELQLKQQEVMLAHQERMAEIARQEKNDQTNAQVQILVAQSKKDVAILQLAQDQKLQIWQVAAAMKKAGLDADTKKVLAEMDMHSKALGEQADNVRTAATLGVKAAETHANIQKEHVHKAADIVHERQMTQMQHQHEKSMPKPQPGAASE